MTTQLEMIDDRYDLWPCVKCGSEKVVRSVPHAPPTCCGTGMWFVELRRGLPYSTDCQ